jgi:hypothetical protein
MTLAWTLPDQGAHLDAHAEQATRAAEEHGVPSREHDAAMDAHAEAEQEAQAG